MAQILDLGKIRFQFKGEWSNGTEYQFNDVVAYKGNAYVYISTAKTIGTLTSNTQFWGRMSNGFDFTGAWAVGTTYGYGSTVRYGGNLYLYTNAVASAGNLPTNTTFWTLLIYGWNFQGTWSSATAYKIGESITHGGIAYVAVQDSTNQNPDANPTYWSTLVQGLQFEGTYNNATAYQKNDLVNYGSNTYIALSNTVGNLPTNATYWSLLVGGFNFRSSWSSATAYKVGDSVALGGNVYVALLDSTNQNPDANPTYWSTIVQGIQYEGAYNNATAYQKNDLVTYGSNTYIALSNTVGNLPTNATYWSLFVSGLVFTGTWSSATAYKIGQSVSHGGNTFIAVQDSTNQNPDANPTFWSTLVQGIQYEGDYNASTAYQKNDIVRHTAGTYIAKTNTVGNLPTNSTFWSLFIPTDSMASDNVYYVTPTGNDSNNGTSMAAAFATIKAACAAAAATGNPSTIKVSTGTYIEVCPITVPANVAIVGDNQRTVNVQPTVGTNNTTMFLMSNGSILNKMTFSGMTGWVPGSTPENITTSTIAGVVVRLNPASPITTKSPYVIECSAICSGAIGALVDGSVHATGAKTMIFHGYTVISDNGVGYWVKDGGKAEIVSGFTYYCYFGYTSSGGGHIRALNGNNSYGTWGATARGFDAAETPITGTLVGEELPFVYTGGTITAGDTVTNGTATATVTNVQISANKIYIKARSGTFSAGNTLTFTSGGTGTCSGAAENQKGFVLVATGFSALPKPGASVTIAGDSASYVVQSTTNTWVNSSSEIVLLLAQEKLTGSASGTAITIRYQYSQVRLTGHDFLSIGTGGTSTTNYPGTPTQPSAQGNEVDEAFPGRVFYVSTDQDGNFRVGEYFKIDQATGKATLNASAFDLSGLSSLRLGSIGAQLGEQINEFSSDGTLSGNSNLAVPTEFAVKTYVDSTGALGAATNVSLTSGDFSASYASPLINVTSASDFRSVNLPSASGAGLVRAKFQIRNTSNVVIGVRDNAGALLTAIQSGGSALLILNNNSSAAGQWSVSGSSLQPFFINNQVVVPNASGTATDNNPGTNIMYSIDLSNTLMLTVHANASSSVSVYATDFSTKPATVTATPLLVTGLTSSSVIDVRRVSATRALIFTLNDVVLVNVSGTTVSLVAALTNAYTSPVRNGATTGSANAVMGFDDELYGVMFGGAAGSTPVLTMVKVDGDVLRNNVLNLTTPIAVVNGWEAIVTSPTTALMAYGDNTAGAAPWNIRVVRLAITKGDSGVAPTAAQATSVQTAALYNGAAYSITLSRDEANPDKVCATAQLNSGGGDVFIITGAVSGSTTLGSAVSFDSGSTVTSNLFGQTTLTKSLRNVGADTWLFAYSSSNTFLRVARVTASGTSATVTLSNLHGKNVNVFTLGPNTSPQTVFATAHGTATTSYSGVMSHALSAGVMDFKEFAPVQHNILFTTLRTHCNWTTDGWVIVTGGLTTTATAVLQQHAQFAIFNVNAAGVPTYYGTYGLPINTNIGVIVNPLTAQPGRIRDSFSSTFYNFAQNIPFRVSLDIEFVKVS
jgi:hypothetical protein